jgi:hypothetical protein
VSKEAYYLRLDEKELKAVMDTIQIHDMGGREVGTSDTDLQQVPDLSVPQPIFLWHT